MKFRLIGISCLLLLFVSCKKTGSDQEDCIERHYGDSFYEKAISVEELPSGDIILFGGVSNDNGDLALIRLTRNCDSIGSTIFYLPDTQNPVSCNLTKDNCIIALGWQYVDGTPCGKQIVYKVTLGGDIVWNKQFISDFYPRSSVITNDNNLVIMGDDGNSMFLLKFDENGDSIGQNKYDFGYVNIGKSIKEMTNGDFVICGSQYPYNGADIARIIFFKTSSSGDLRWCHITGYDTQGKSIEIMKNGNLTVFGLASSGLVDTTKIIKADLDGNIISIKSIDAFDIKASFITPDNKILIAEDGIYNSLNYDYSPGVKIVLLDSTYNILHSQIFDDITKFELSSIIMTTDEKNVFCGRSWKYTKDFASFICKF